MVFSNEITFLDIIWKQSELGKTSQIFAEQTANGYVQIIGVVFCSLSPVCEMCATVSTENSLALRLTCRCKYLANR
jgi:hypothetical protein